MFDELENNSGKICIVLVGATLVGGAILVFGAPAFAAAYVTVHAVELLTVAASVGAVASGASYWRRESANRAAQSQFLDIQEQDRRTALATNFIGENRNLFESRDATNLHTNAEPGSEETRQRIATLEAEDRTKAIRLERVERLINTALRGMSRREIDEERESYRAGNYSDCDSDAEESKQPLLSEQNMFRRPSTMVSLEISANDASQQQRDGSVHRRRLGANSSLN